MANILIQSNAIFDYALTSDNVFGPASDFPYPVTVYYITDYYTGYWYEEWTDDQAVSHSQIINLDPPPYVDPMGGHGFLGGTYSSLTSNGIVFTPTTPVDWSAGAYGQTNVERYDQPTLPATLLAGADTITNQAGAALLSGYGGADTIVGGTGADTLDGGAGNDSLVGGLGNDVYYVDYNADRVIETAGQGFDTVYSSNTFTATAGSSIERLVALGSGNVALTGNGLAMEIIGNSGVNTLDDGGGAATLKGGGGVDVYMVHNTATQVVELAGQGFDTVYTTNTFKVAAGSSIERLIASGSANVALTGNGLAIEIIGNSGVNTLDDAGGAATLKGGGGVDVYLVHNAATQVVELVNEGYDTVRTDLAAYTLGANLEVLTRLGSAAFQGTGNALANVLTGGGGADTLDGGGGNDVLTGGLGGDLFRFANLTSGIDRITDFHNGADLIGLSAAGFGIATLANVVLVAGDTAVAAGQAALHYYANGGLSFDANGGAANDGRVVRQPGWAPQPGDLRLRAGLTRPVGPGGKRRA